MVPAGDTRRIGCPRCGSNNFVGTPQCWRCGASLPPPEEIGQLNSPTGNASVPPSLHGSPTTAGGPVLPQAGPTAQWRVVLAVVLAALVCVVIGMVVAGVIRRNTTSSPRQALESLNPIKERLMRERGLSGRDAWADDSVEARAREELRRLERRLGTMQPGGSETQRLPSGDAGDQR